MHRKRRWILWQVAVAVAVLCSNQMATAEEPLGDRPAIRWLQSAREAAELAASQQRPIIVYVRSGTCGYCDLLQRNVLDQPAVIDFIHSEFVPLKLTREEHAEQLQALAVTSFPTVLVFSPRREFLFRIDGYVDAETFVQRLTRAERGGQRTASAARPGAKSRR